MKALVLPEIEAYAEAHSAAESEVCRALREETYRTMELPQMVVGPLEGALLNMMAHLVGARRVLEIGMFTGYSALCFAEALPEDGRVITCEIDPKSAALARKYFAKSLHGRKIEIKLGPALETLQALTGPFDLIFIDADKVNYLHYYRRALERVAPQGVILIDNVLWSGDVLLQPAPDASTAVIQELNRTVAADPRVTAVLLTVRDGVLVVRPRPGLNKTA
ncbi:MAG: O-methyltransferase [Nitrospiraceae bacterium]